MLAQATKKARFKDGLFFREIPIYSVRLPS
jgi:hypothetical protein